MDAYDFNNILNLTFSRALRLPIYLSLGVLMDPVIHSLLNNLFKTTGIDPAAIHPDERLVEDLAMSQNDIRKLCEGLVRDMRLPGPLHIQSVKDLSLRQLSILVKEALQEIEEKIAA